VLTLLAPLHAIAARRGDGLHPELANLLERDADALHISSGGTKMSREQENKALVGPLVRGVLGQSVESSDHRTRFDPSRCGRAEISTPRVVSWAEGCSPRGTRERRAKPPLGRLFRPHSAIAFRRYLQARRDKQPRANCRAGTKPQHGDEVAR
jgi:hypothetical protein